MSKNKSMAYQVKGKLGPQLRIGDSKHQAKINEHTKNPSGIFSWGTYNTYVKECTQFAQWAKDTHGCKNLDEARAYAQDYIDYRVSQGCSAWTVKLEASALNKLYVSDHPDGLHLTSPSRYRSDVTRSRNECEHDRHFSEVRNQHLVDFCKGTGLRRHELQQLKNTDIYKRNDGKVYVWVQNGKGGKSREIPVRAGYEEKILSFTGTDASNVFTDIPNRMDVHSYRSEYATALYKSLARPFSTIPKEDRYYCRGDLKGVVYDKSAMLKVSEALGHNRISVIAYSYLR